jgi:hypothetical protein
VKIQAPTDKVPKEEIIIKGLELYCAKYWKKHSPTFKEEEISKDDLQKALGTNEYVLGNVEVCFPLSEVSSMSLSLNIWLLSCH